MTWQHHNIGQLQIKSQNEKYTGTRLFIDPLEMFCQLFRRAAQWAIGRISQAGHLRSVSLLHQNKDRGDGFPNTWYFVHVSQLRYSPYYLKWWILCDVIDGGKVFV